MTTIHLGGKLPHVRLPASDGRRLEGCAMPAKVVRMEGEEDTIVESVALAAAPFLTRGVELTELLGALVDAVVRQIGADRGTLYLVDGAARTVTSIISDAPGTRRRWSSSASSTRRCRMTPRSCSGRRAP